MMCSSFITKLKFGQGNVFTHVCHSVHRVKGGSLYDVTPFLVTWSYVPSREGVSVPGPMFLLRGGLCPWCHVHSRGSISRGSLSRRVSVQGVSVRRPSESEKRTVHILLECFLVSVYFALMSEQIVKYRSGNRLHGGFVSCHGVTSLSTLIKL